MPLRRELAAQAARLALHARTLSTAAAAAAGAGEKQVLYKGPLRRTLRLLCRFKLTQLGAAAATASLPLGASAEALPPMVAAGLFALAAGSAATSGTLFFFSRRYVGELALLPGGVTRISTFDFWGARAEVELRRGALLHPPFAGLGEAERREMGRAAVIPLNFEGEERQFLLIPRFGQVVDGAALSRFLAGEQEDDGVLNKEE